MDPLTTAAASGFRARMESLEMLANNLANTTTAGYKTDREFYGLYLSPEAGNVTPDEPGALPIIERPWLDLSQGMLRTTGNPCDLALSGKGFFAVNASSGTVYTRNGNFRLSTTGELVTAEGYAVRDTNGKAVKLQAQKSFEVDTTGTVRQDGAVVGKLQIVDFPDPSALSKMGNSYFQYDASKAQPVPATATEVQQGKLESSNVAAAEAAVRLVGVMRQFEMLQKAITLGADMNERSLQEVARVGS